MAEREVKKTAEDELKDDVDKIKADLDALRKDLGNVLGNLKGAASEKAETEIAAMRKRLDRMASDVQSGGREGLRAIEEQIEERPIASLAMAFAIGLILGRMFDRR